MPKTIIEKIFANHTSEKVIPGNNIWLNIDLVTARDFGGANVVKNLEREYPDKPIGDIAKSAFTFDCVVPANNIPYAQNQQIIRDFARKWNVKLLDSQWGIGTHNIIEKGWTLPGDTALGTDSHFNILGALGVFGQGMGDIDIAFAFKTRKVWFEIPSTVRINLKGIPKFPVTPKDVVLELLRNFGTKGLLGKVVELYGDYIDALGLDGRITIASMGTELGLVSFFFPPSEEIKKEIKDIAGYDAEFISSDKDAKYEEEYTVDISNLEPLLAAPYSPANVNPVREYLNTPIDTVFVGSCTNGRVSDFRIVSEIIGDNSVDNKVTLKLVPSTRYVYSYLMNDGIAQQLFSAGGILSHPACAGCASGQIGMTGAGERQLSTGNRNFKGKQGAGETFIVSPVIAAISAKNGKISLP